MPVTSKLSLVPASAFNPDDLVPIEEVARRLHNTISWVREKVRPRSPNPMPVHNVGRHLLFHWPTVCDWVRGSTRPVHMKHRRRKSKAA